MRRTQKQTARGRGLGLILFAALIGVPLIEIALFISVGGWLGLVPTLILIVLTAVVGAWMLRVQGFAVLSRAQRQMAEGVLPVAEVFEGLCLLVAGALLLTPGFLTDAVGALLLMPACRRLLYRFAGQRLELQVAAASQAAAGPGRPGHAGGRRPGPVVDAEFRVVTPESEPPAEEAPPSASTASDPAPSDPTLNDPSMPPPRGGWSRRS